jgi:hypothetical protein
MNVRETIPLTVMNSLRIAPDFLRGLSLWLYPLRGPSVRGESFVAPDVVGVIYDSRYFYNDWIP